jgi:hypothetical protein
MKRKYPEQFSDYADLPVTAAPSSTPKASPPSARKVQVALRVGLS